MSKLSEQARIIVVGCGNAALCAAISARQAGAEVLVLERAPKDLRGGNSAFTGGIMRLTYDSTEELTALVGDLDQSELESPDFELYTQEQFFDDLGRVTEYRADPELAETLVSEARETLLWMRELGIRFQPMYRPRPNSTPSFSGVPTVDVWGGGVGLVDALSAEAERLGIEIRYEHEAIGLIRGEGGIEAIDVRTSTGQVERIHASSVVLAAGGFSANREWRARYLGPGWDLAKVRGSRFDTGGGIAMAFELGAAPAGHWSGCHAIAWDRNASDFGDINRPAAYQRHGYPYGIVVNADGKRFLDEGADFRNITYSKYGRQILAQPQQTAWQIFDAKTSPLLNEEYRLREVTRVRADSLEQLADKLDGIDAQQFLKTIHDFNAAVQTEVPFDPSVKDGRGTEGLEPAKTNWANPIDTAPFDAYQVTCGITFTFGGVKIDSNGCVLDINDDPIDGLFACGEMAGGLFYFASLDGLGLSYGSVFGRRAGAAAAQHAAA